MQDDNTQQSYDILSAFLCWTMPRLFTLISFEDRNITITTVNKTVGATQWDGETKSIARKMCAEEPAILSW